MRLGFLGLFMKLFGLPENIIDSLCDYNRNFTASDFTGGANIASASSLGPGSWGVL
jgi:hypothetical protein